MNADSIQGIIRAILSAAGGFIIGKGWIDSETWLAVSGAGLTLFTAVWSVMHNNSQTKATAQVQAVGK